MQIKIEIDVKPEELRRFLGLPDVAGLQEDIIQYLRDRLGAAAESGPASFVKETLRRGSAPWRKFFAAVKEESDGSEAEESREAPAPIKRRRKRAAKPEASADPAQRAAESEVPATNETAER